MESSYKPIIGLEIHVELKTRTKMFCNSLNDPDEHHPNVNVCPVCLGHPGTLPTINKEAVRSVIKVGLALDGKINTETKFDRKNYFYPDIPKAYQISQYDKPLVVGGMLKNVRIRRIHLEEDTANLTHVDGASLVDYNRAGLPLMELVTEPDIKDPHDIADFARELQLILRYIGVSDADMEKGQMRIEANVSLAECIEANGADLNTTNDGTTGTIFKDEDGVVWRFGTKVELKNINSFKAAQSAAAYELKRHEEVLARGEKIHQETRGWDEAKQRTISQRSKEDAHDYRYFPEPDLPPFETKFFDIEALKASLPELPAAKRKRFMSEYDLNETQADLLVAEPKLAGFFEECVSELGEFISSSPRAASSPRRSLYNYLTGDLRGLMNEAGVSFNDLKFGPEHLAHLVTLIEAGKITSRQGKDVLVKMFETGLDPEDIVRNEKIGVSSDASEIEPVIDAIIAENPSAVADYKKGKTASMQFLIGKAMGALKGRARPDILKEIFERKLKD
jgi:aspartyl-tRNA(Asn)/glutamyl-tRNA(Gln) amidotransferase subunit B